MKVSDISLSDLQLIRSHLNSQNKTAALGVLLRNYKLTTAQAIKLLHKIEAN
jgi:hypothetical protein